MKKTCEICGEEFDGTKNQRICHNKIHTRICEVCGKEFIVNTKNIDKTTCSRDCTFIKKYGGNPFQSDSVKSKIKETNLRKYGVENVMSLDSTKSKIRATSIERYGVDNPMKSDSVKFKSKESSLSKYGVSHPKKSEEVKRRCEKSLVEKYGVRNVFQLDEVKSKIRDTNLSRYGVEIPTKSDIVKDKTKSTCIERYDNESYIGSEDYFNKTISTNTDKYGVPFYCMTDHCRKSANVISKINLRFGELLEKNNIEYEYECRLGNYSYDLHIINSNILIEIDPTYTHNSLYGFKSKDPIPNDYHMNKSLNARLSGFRCIHIFDWDNWNKLVEIINNNKNIIYARKCEILELSKNECDRFINDNHLQSTCRGQSVRIGLYYNSELVQVITFGKPRYNKNYQYELLRLCTKLDTLVVGGANRLFNYFIRNYDPDSIISYCDEAKFEGTIYERLGFKYKKTTLPRRIWSKGNKMITDNLLNQRGYDQLFGTNYGKGTSNENLMIDNGWLPIYDCGQGVYSYISENCGC